MTVRELIEKLQTMSPDALVVASSDAEGNYHSPLAGADDGLWWLSDDHEIAEEEYRGGVPCVVVWPS